MASHCSILYASEDVCVGRIQRHGVWRGSPQGTPGCRKSSGLLCQVGEVTEGSEQGRPVQGGSWEPLQWGSLHPTESPRTLPSSPLSSTPPLHPTSAPGHPPWPPAPPVGSLCLRRSWPVSWSRWKIRRS